MKNNNRTLLNDLNFGLSRENHILEIIREYFKDITIKSTKEKYNNSYIIYDYESDNLNSYELKSRRIFKDTYSTTILQVSKIRNVNTAQYFIFAFMDCVMFIKYDKDTFSKFIKKNILLQRSDCVNKNVSHFEIPIHFLSLIS